MTSLERYLLPLWCLGLFVAVRTLTEWRYLSNLMIITGFGFLSESIEEYLTHSFLSSYWKLYLSTDFWMIKMLVGRCSAEM